MAPFSARARWIIAVLALVAACLLAIAVTSPTLGRWWSVGDAVAIGPGGTSACFAGQCETRGLEWIGGDAIFRRAAVAVSTASMIATATLIALAAALVAKRRGTLAAGATMTATLTAAIAGIVFFVTFPGTSATGGAAASVDRGLFLFAGAIVLAIGLAAAVIRRGR